MRLPALITIAAVLGLLTVSASGKRDKPDSNDSVKVTVKLVDENGKPIPGLIRVSDEKGNRIDCPELLPRGLGLKQPKIERWFVLPKSAVVTLPRTKLTITAIAGIETEQATLQADLSKNANAEATLTLPRFFDRKGQRSGNTHLHLKDISREVSDRYLKEVPLADGLDLLFVSYLERAVADRGYITNKYSKQEIESLGKGSSVVYGNGEEHRHNFAGFGQGYGHVMLLDISQLVLPVSIGPGIMKTGTDGIPLQRGIDTARRDDATIVWCHNHWGAEALPNFLTGRLDALNIFDGGVHGSYKDSFYRYLNAGIRVPFSTGTDWFMYDFSRVYVRMKGQPSVDAWLEGLAAGRSFITNGPLLDFQINQARPGDTVEIDQPGTVSVEAKCSGRVDFKRIEVVLNGKVVATAKSRKVDGHFEAHLSDSIKLEGPGWLALRTPPPPVKDVEKLAEAVGENAFGRQLFSHTSPVYVEVNGQQHFDPAVAKGLLAEMLANRKMIKTQGRFADAVERARVLDVHQAGIEAMQKKLGL